MLPSGDLSLRATDGDITVGGRLDLSGRAVQFYDLVKFVDGGSIALTADAGNVTLGVGSTIDVSASAAGGNAGKLSIAVPGGALTLSGTLKGKGGVHGRDGSFSLDASSLPSIAAIGAILTKGSFTEAQSYRVRSGDVAIDGALLAHSFRLSADTGSITVTAGGLP